ncbi:PALP domain-containing protein [Mycena indigotica]|uniref:L-serine ammonia-lyase n=1 Tax=Mycena indigotica TaxID=2126181 RepID=A0A8H6SA36_9AGAR|nr:PALP domain-containing protein [Mycena indigotica]KAF7295118.1 PALP domain-containing protein [Mycena indigotica]
MAAPLASPLIRSSRLSSLSNALVNLKLETVHPAMSFKSRGIGYFVECAKQAHGSGLHVVVASGGNAGLAAACAARQLQVRCTVFIPEGATQTTINLLEGEDADVVVGGKDYAEALQAAKILVDSKENAVMVPAYDDPVVWEGHSSLVSELAHQLPQTRPRAIFCSVGGGGLLGGVIKGCARAGWDAVPIVALETIGSDCFYHSLALNRQGQGVDLPAGVKAIYDQTHQVWLAHFSSFASKASGSLGASQPAAGVVKMALERAGPVISVTVPDELSMQAAYNFADDHQLLVELACSTTLVPAYKKELLDEIFPGTDERPFVFVVCGGFKISVQDLTSYRAQAEAYEKEFLEVYCDGKVISVRK